MWAYEVDGFGGTLLMDDAGAPGLLSLPYLECCDLGDSVYHNSRRFSLSEANPYFCRGKAGEGLGSPHEGLNMIWPMGTVYRAMTTNDEKEIRECLRSLRDTTAGTGFMHESFAKDDASNFTRPWFAWANTLFGELIVRVVAQRPGLLAAALG
jgi:meiotically up-regulated gene 157 (Mug157) protein